MGGDRKLPGRRQCYGSESCIRGTKSTPFGNWSSAAVARSSQISKWTCIAKYRPKKISQWNAPAKKFLGQKTQPHSKQYATVDFPERGPKSILATTGNAKSGAKTHPNATAGNTAFTICTTTGDTKLRATNRARALRPTTLTSTIRTHSARADPTACATLRTRLDCTR